MQHPTAKPARFGAMAKSLHAGGAVWCGPAGQNGCIGMMYVLDHTTDFIAAYPPPGSPELDRGQS